jgi:hypothetical protein
MRSLAVALAAVVGLVAVGCGGGSGSPATGTERGPCYGNGTCNTGLVCLSNTCVKPPPTGTAGTTGTAGVTGTAGTTGTAGAGGTAGTAGTAGTGGASGAGGSAGGRGGAGGTGGTGGTGGSTGGTGGVGGTLSCSDYCTTIMTTCTGMFAQYTTMAVCQAACPTFPLGTFADTHGNTLGCRNSYAEATIPGASAALCAAAGPSGGGVCGTDPCLPYCALVAANCPATYASIPECMSACQTNFAAASGDYSTAVTSLTNHSVYCYLAFAALAGTNPIPQCPHVVMNATACGM